MCVCVCVHVCTLKGRDRERFILMTWLIKLWGPASLKATGQFSGLEAQNFYTTLLLFNCLKNKNIVNSPRFFSFRCTAKWFNYMCIYQSVQSSHSVGSGSLRPHAHQVSYSSPSPGVHPDSCPSSWWCHPTISSSVVSFPSCLLSFPASGVYIYIYTFMCIYD